MQLLNPRRNSAGTDGWPAFFAWFWRRVGIKVRTSICPPRTLTSRHGCGCTAGPFSTRPSSKANLELCSGHTMLSPSSLPSESGPLKWEQGGLPCSAGFGEG